MIDSDLVEVKVNARGYKKPVGKPAIYYGALIKNEYDNQRVITNSGMKIKHKTRDISSSNIIERYIKGVPIEQPLMLHRLYREFKTLNPSCTGFAKSYNKVLDKYNLTCSEGMGYISHGMLLVDGVHINTVTDVPIRNVLKLDLDAKNWFEGFANLHIFIMY